MKKIFAAILLASIMLMTLSSCSRFDSDAVFDLIEEGKYEEAYGELSKHAGDKESDELLSHFYWVPTQVVSGDTVEVHVYNEFNLPEKVMIGDTVVDEYYYDDFGRNIKTVEQWDEERDRIIEYEYDDNGNITKLIYSRSDGGSSTTTYTYNDDGSIATKNIQLSDEEPYTVEMIYNEKGDLVKEIQKNSDETRIETDHEYDEAQNLISSLTEFLDGTTETAKYTYDEKNRLLTSETKDRDGLCILYTYTYDEQGRVNLFELSSTYLGEKLGGDLYSKYEYDENGNVVRCTSHNGSSDTPVVSDITYRLVYIKYDLESKVNWTIIPLIPH